VSGVLNHWVREVTGKLALVFPGARAAVQDLPIGFFKSAAIECVLVLGDIAGVFASCAMSRRHRVQVAGQSCPRRRSGQPHGSDPSALLAGIDRRAVLRSEYAPLPDCARRLLNAGHYLGRVIRYCVDFPPFSTSRRALRLSENSRRSAGVKPSFEYELRASVSWSIFEGFEAAEGRGFKDIEVMFLAGNRFRQVAAAAIEGLHRSSRRWHLLRRQRRRLFQ